MHLSASAVRDDPSAAMRSRVTSLVVNDGEKAEDSRESSTCIADIKRGLVTRLVVLAEVITKAVNPVVVS